MARLWLFLPPCLKGDFRVGRSREVIGGDGDWFRGWGWGRVMNGVGRARGGLGGVEEVVVFVCWAERL